MKHPVNILLAVILALGLRIYLSTSIYSGDVNNHIAWSAGILESGFSGAYDRSYSHVMQPTYPPLALYSFVTSHWLFNNLNSLVRFVHFRVNIHLSPSFLVFFFENQNVLPAFHKIVSIFSDIGIGILIYLLAKTIFNVKSPAAFGAMCLYLFNPSVFYNSTLWGQLESVPVFFVLLAVWLLLHNKYLSAHASFMAALLFKQSSLLFFPVFAVFSIKKVGWRKTLLGLVLQCLLFYAAYLPFINWHTDNLFYPVSVYINRFQTGSGSDYISDHAFNLWALFSHLAKISDSVEIIRGISASLFGQLIFICLTAILFSRFLVSRKNTALINLFGLLAFTSFMFLTRMHERYLAPVLPFMAISASKNRQLWPIYFLVSLAHLINMYHQWWFPDIPVLVPLVSAWVTIVSAVIILFISWYSWIAVYFNESQN